MKAPYSIMVCLSFACCVLIGTTLFAQRSTGNFLSVDTFKINKNLFLETLKTSCNTHSVLKKINAQALVKLEQAVKALPQVKSVSSTYGKRESDFFVAYEGYNDRQLVNKMYEALPAIQIESFSGCPHLSLIKLSIANHQLQNFKPFYHLHF